MHCADLHGKIDCLGSVHGGLVYHAVPRSFYPQPQCCRAFDLLC
jgi:hypothetical protein